MTAVTIDDQAASAKRPRRRRFAIAVLSAAVLVAGVTGIRWYSGLDVLTPYPAFGGSSPAKVGHTLFVDTGISAERPAGQDGNPLPSSIPLTVTSITPRVDSNTSGAAVEVLVCQRSGSSTGVGTQETGLSDSCSAVTPFVSPMTLDLGFMTTQILVAVTPSRPGAIHLAGFDVSYSQGLRRATQRSGFEFTFTTP